MLSLVFTNRLDEREEKTMFQYDYKCAETVEEVCTALNQDRERIRIIAGGTDLMVQIKEKNPKWKEIELLLDITSLEQELRKIADNGNAVYIGALSTHTDIEESDIVKQYLPFLGEACSTVGSTQIRNRGTLGGSICNASPAADPLTPLVASGAVVVIQGMTEKRIVNIEDFYTAEGGIDLQAGEFVIGFEVPKLPKGTLMAFSKLGRRKALAISRVNSSVAIRLNEAEIIEEARIAPGCIFAKPMCVTKAQELIVGSRPSYDLFLEAGKIVSEEMIRYSGIRWSTKYKKPAVEGIVQDALMKSVGMEIQ